MKRVIAALICATLTGRAADMPTAETPTRRVSLIELFTSQSCSSCPPADAYLGELARRPDVLALTFHVDYWNNLGWRDPYSSRDATARQRLYARQLDAETYTPQIVVDGRGEAVGSDRAAVEQLLRRAAAPTVAASIGERDGHFIITVDAAATPSDQATILLVTFDPRHRTQIGGGENGGRSLETFNDVRSIRHVGDWQGAGLTIDAERATEDRGARAAVIVQAADGSIVAVAATAPT